MTSPSSLPAVPANLKELLDTLEVMVIRYTQRAPNAESDLIGWRECLANLAAARQSLVEYVEGIRAERDAYHRIVEDYIRIGSVESCQFWKAEYQRALEVADAELSALKEDALTADEAQAILNVASPHLAAYPERGVRACEHLG